MARTARDEILERLKAAPPKELAPRPTLPPPTELSWDREKMIEKFTENLVAQTGVVHRVNDYNAAVDALTNIAESESLTKVMASMDDVTARLNLPQWGSEHRVHVFVPSTFKNRNAFKDAVFVEAQAGITGVDFAIAESGTLVLVHNKVQPRLISLAPIMHIAIVPLERLYPVYEAAVEKVFGNKSRAPSQVTFITGPSMTGDIQGVPFKGMHGPKKLTVILVG
jgi:L-lactate dehydrogenase complex protein LldG